MYMYYLYQYYMHNLIIILLPYNNLVYTAFQQIVLYDVASESDITTCMTIDNSLVVYTFSNVMVSVITMLHIYGKLRSFTHINVLLSYL